MGHISEDGKRRLREFHLGRHLSIETRQKISEAQRGKKRSVETGRRISRALCGRVRSAEHCRKLSDALRAKPSYGMLGRHHSEIARRKISEAHIGKYHSEETKQKISESHRGERSATWRGGVSYVGYSSNWTRTLKRSIRERDGYICQRCGLQQRQGDKDFSVHHVDFNKQHCDPKNLLTLCTRCHSQVTVRRIIL